VESDRAHKAFGEHLGLDFPLLSDFNRQVVAQYGIHYEESYGSQPGSPGAELVGPGGVLGDWRGMSKRAVFVIAQDGTVRYKWVSEDPRVAPDVEPVIEALQEIRQARA
jgi:peroxiredoxin